jgi:hypothetical protein
MADAPANPYPVACFFQPARNIPAMLALGVNVFFGPEVEARSSLLPTAIAAKEAEWIQAVLASGAKCVLKRPPAVLPPNCIGVLFTVDEPNGKGIPASALVAERDDLRARYPGVPLFLSLAGDKITSANLKKQHELDALTAYLDLVGPDGVVTVDVYDNNRNASRYPETWEADAVKTVKAVRPVKCWPWLECNDQQLAAPTSQTVPGVVDIGREPTPDEIKQSVNAVLAQGADGIGWFFTADKGQYGWGVKDPAKGDSYLPMVNRKGESMAPQYDMVASISKSLNPSLPPLPDNPAPDARDALVAELQRQVADAEKRAETAADQYAVCAARVAELQDAIRGLLSASDAVDVAKAKLVTAAK